MASLATRQSITLLGVIGGSLKRIDECNMFSVVRMKELVRNTYKQVVHIMDVWPEDTHSYKDGLWINYRIDEWGKYILSVKEHHTLPVFATVCDRCLTDLQEMVRHPVKQQLLSTIEEPIKSVHNFIDPYGANFPAFEKAGDVMDKLYNLIEWEWK